jgi:hypothetical protein
MSNTLVRVATHKLCCCWLLVRSEVCLRCAGDRLQRLRLCVFQRASVCSMDLLHRTVAIPITARARAAATRGEQLASIPLVEGRRALRGEKPNRSTLKQGCGGCRDRSEFKNRTEQIPPAGGPRRVQSPPSLARLCHNFAALRGDFTVTSRQLHTNFTPTSHQLHATSHARQNFGRSRYW